MSRTTETDNEYFEFFKNGNSLLGECRLAHTNKKNKAVWAEKVRAEPNTQYKMPFCR